MPKVWNLGNTTVRNPNRLRDGLILLSEEFNGRLYGAEQEGNFSRRLNEVGIIDSEGTSPDWFGRKWRSAFVKLGFITEKFSQRHKTIVQWLTDDFGFTDAGYEVTPAGRLLIGADSLGAIEDIFTRQLIQHEISSPLEGSFPEGSMKPFILFLQVLYRLHREGQPGLNKLEIAAFIQLFRNHTPSISDEVVNDVLEFRKKRAACRDKREKGRCDQEALESASRLKIEGSVAPDSLGDYADTTVRYTKMTGLIAEAGSRVIVRETKIAFIEAVLAREPVFLATVNPSEYLKKFYSGGEIPTDDRVFAHQEINRVSRRLEEMGKVIPQELITKAERADVKELEQVRYKLLELVNQSEEEVYALNQQKDEFIKEILEGLTAFGNNGAKRMYNDLPTYFEWIVWRSFLAIDHIAVPVHTTRRFPVDEDILPRHPAPGGGPDMQFEFKDFILVVEVTLKTSSRQEADEGEPVRRHVAVACQDNQKDVYGVFIAPTIDTNTAETFRAGVWYHREEVRHLKIVPFSIEQFRLIFSALLNKRYTPGDLKGLIDQCLSVRQGMHAPEWKKHIDEETKRWCQGLIAQDERFIDQIEREVNESLKFVEYLPVYTLAAACGKFGEGQEVEPEGWIRVEKRDWDRDITFVARAVGNSMDPKIKDGDYCIFKANPGGPYSKQGRIYLLQYRGKTDPETMGSYSIKGYRSHKGTDGLNVRVELIPFNKSFESMFFDEDEHDMDSQLIFVAEFAGVLDGSASMHG